MSQIEFSAMTFATVELRAAVPSDDEFCFQLHKAAMGEYVAAIWGWDDQDQRALHARVFNPHRWQIITADQVDVGMIDIEHRRSEVHLGRIEILPEYQNRGIGTQLIQKLIDLSIANGDDLTLDVLAVNLRARALYQRLGMTEIARHGDKDVKIRMRHTAR